jgi:hypothetical protein
MKKLKNLKSRFFILFTCIGLVISFNSCVEDQKDKDLILAQTFLEKHKATKWTVIEEDMRIYVRLNNDKDKDLEIWMAELGFKELMASKECFYYSQELLNTEDVEVIENFGSKLAFTYLDNETYTFSIDEKRLKLEFETLDNLKQVVYFSKTTDNVDGLDICPEERSKDVFNWRFLKQDN